MPTPAAIESTRSLGRAVARPADVDTGRAGAHRAPPFGSVLCGIGAGLPSLEAARQAALIAAGGRLTLVAIEGANGVGPEWAELAAAFVLAARDSEPPAVLEIAGDRVLPPLMMLAGRHDLLAIGAHDAGSRREDITRAIVHQSPVPVLVTRPCGHGARVADRILIVCSDQSDAAAAVAATLAERHGSTLETVTVPAGSAPGARDAATRSVLALAERFGATLVVISSRGLAGVAGLASVSAAVAADAHCSVLVLRPGR